MSVRNLDALFQPASVVLVGASSRVGAVGNLLLKGLTRNGYAGTVMAVNPKGQPIEGVPTFASVAELPEKAELAVVCTPPETIPQIISDLGAQGTRGAVVITAGFAEMGTEGKALQQAVLDAARPHLMRIVGPNCLGLIAPRIGLNASFTHRMPDTGDIAFISQSGAVVTGMVDWAASRGIGFSHIVSLGAMSDVDFGDLLDYLAADTKTKGILLYVESVKDAAKFMSAGRAASRLKPVVVLKAGRSQAGARAAQSHTGALAGQDAVYTAAFRRSGMLRVDSLDELLDAVETLSSRVDRKPLHGNRLGILTNGGGLGVLATDFLMAEGGELADLTPETIDRLDAVLPPTWSKANPVDIIGDAPGSRYLEATKILLDDPGTDAVLAINCPTAVADNVEAAEAVLTAARGSTKPLFTTWLGDEGASKARAVLHGAGVPTFETGQHAVHAFMHLVRHRRNQALLNEIPPLGDSGKVHDTDAARAAIEAALQAGRDWLSPAESRAVLSAYGIPVVSSRFAATAEDAASAARVLGFPAALKIKSPQITHKTDVGGVALDLRDEAAVLQAANDMAVRVANTRPDAVIDGFIVEPMVSPARAVELIVGLVSDPVFGPVVLFGQGGTAVEILDDKALALPPLNRALAEDLISRTRVARLLESYRGQAAINREGIIDVIRAIGDLAADIPQITELDINPLWANAGGVVALDARIRVEARAVAEPGAHFAVRPYPVALEGQITDRTGKCYPVRPVRPEDATRLEALMAEMEPEDIRLRFLSPLKTLPRHLVARLTQIDYAREMAFVALEDQGDGETAIAGAARLTADPDNERAEYAVLVRSRSKGSGLGYALMQHLIAYARARGIGEMFGIVMRENAPMLAMCTSLGFLKRPVADDPGLIEVVLPLQGPVQT